MELARDTVKLVGDLGLGGRGANLVIPSIVGPTLATVLVFNRVYWRISKVHTLGLDDICITLSLGFLYLLSITNIVAVDHGYGRPSKSLPKSDLHLVLQMFYLSQIFYKLTINLTKLSILCLYLCIFSEPWFRPTCWACVIVILGYSLASIVASIFQCTPIPHYWDKSKYPTGTCIDFTTFWYANAIYNIITDFVILVSPPRVVWKLRLPLRQRLGLMAVFGLGIFVFTTSILRMTTLDHSGKAHDTSEGTLISTIWSMIETSAAIVCACLPMLRTPLKKVAPHLFPSCAASGTIRKEKRRMDMNGSAARKDIHPAHCAVVCAAANGVPEDGVKRSVPLVSIDETITWATTTIGERLGEGDLEMGSVHLAGWPKRLSNPRVSNSLTLLPSTPSTPVGRESLLSDSNTCVSYHAYRLMNG